MTGHLQNIPLKKLERLKKAAFKKRQVEIKSFLTSCDEETRNYVLSIKKSKQYKYIKAIKGELTLRKVVELKCLSCCAFKKDAVENCSHKFCPLFQYRGK